VVPTPYPVLAALMVAAGCAPSKPAVVSPQEKPSMTSSKPPSGYRRVTGSFELTMSPQPPYDTTDGVILGRLTLNKRFHGGLEATSVVEMISVTSGVKGSGGYVAVERVTGTLEGRTGGFVLQHSGSMTRGEPQMAVSIVPGSGTGQLSGIAGRMSIDIVDGKHFFTLDYRLGDGPSGDQKSGTPNPQELASLNGLRMRAVATGEGGEVNRDTLFVFSQDGATVSARYAGGTIRVGYLVGSLSAGRLTFRFAQVDLEGQVDGGHSVGEISILPDGRARLLEYFHWESRDGAGTNVLEEVLE